MAILKSTVDGRKFIFKPLTDEQMRQIAERSLAAEKARIRSGLNAHGSPSKALAEAYARQKTRKGLPAIRDLFFTGRTLNLLRVKTATAKSIVLGSNDQLVRLIIDKANAFEPIWQASETGRRIVQEGIKQAMEQAVKLSREGQ